MNSNVNMDGGFSLLKRILEALPDGVFTLNHELVITYVNPAFCQLMGFETEEMIGHEITEYLGDLSILTACHDEVFATGSCRDQETTFRHKDGSLVNISKNVQMMTDENGQPFIIVSVRDLTQVHELNKQLAKSAEQLEQYNQNLSDRVLQRTQRLNEQMAFLSSYKKALDASSLVSICNPDQQMTQVNDALCQRSGYTAAELVGQDCSYLWTDEYKALLPAVLDCVLNGDVWKGQVSAKSKQGEIFYIEACIVPIIDEAGMVRELVNISYDITPLIESREAMLHRLHHDALTELPNRTKLLSDTEESANSKWIALFNIDSFNEINAFYGVEVADKLLQAIAVRLSQLITELPAQIYKLPVDEYALVIHKNWKQQEFEQFVNSLIEHVSEQGVLVEEANINVTMTAGLASSDRIDELAKDVVIAADMALKMAKKHQKPFIFYDPQMNIKEGYEKNLNWIQRLRSAMDEDRLVPFYQPIVNRRTLKVERYECLVRIIENDGSVISPFHFLEVAKKLKLYPLLTQRMIEKSFAKFADQPFHFSINLSIEDIVDPAMSAWLLKKVQACQFSERIIFEIVESEGIQNYDVVNRFIQEVKRYGVQIAIDDFGAGYSNFAYIMRLDVDFIKIDGSIIRDIHQNRSSQVITETILDFAKKLDIQTVAEFVADEAVYDYVKHLQVDCLQGYLFGEPHAELLPGVDQASA